MVGEGIGTVVGISVFSMTKTLSTDTIDVGRILIILVANAIELNSASTSFVNSIEVDASTLDKITITSQLTVQV